MFPKAETACSVVWVVFILGDTGWHMLSPGDLLQTVWTLPFLPANSGPLHSLLCSTLLFCPFLFLLLLSLLDISSLISVPPYQGKLANPTVCQGLAAVTVFLLTWVLVTRIAPQSGSESVRAHFLGGVENLTRLGDLLRIWVSYCRQRGRKIF